MPETPITRQFIVSAADNQQRLDAMLAQHCPDFSRVAITEWIKQGLVKINDVMTCKPSTRVATAQSISLTASLPAHEEWHAQAIPLNIVFEDETLLVINKPADLVVHPGAGQKDQTLLNALLYHCEALRVLPRAGIIHRLDKGTTGLLVIAKTPFAYQALVSALQARDIHRHYLAVVEGLVTASGHVETHIARHPIRRTHMAVVQKGRWAKTHYKVIQRFRGHTLLKLTLETGRTHQIRVHMAHIHHPLVGDGVYNPKPKWPCGVSVQLLENLQQFKRQALHATELRLIHPVTLQALELTAPLPEDLQTLLQNLAND